MDTENFLDCGDNFQLPDGNYLRGIFNKGDVLHVKKEITFKLLDQKERKQAYHAVYGNELCLYSDMMFNGRRLPFDKPVQGSIPSSKYRGYGTMISANSMTMAQAMVLLKLSVTMDAKIGVKSVRKVKKTIKYGDKTFTYMKKDRGVRIVRKDQPLPMIAATIDPFLDAAEVKDQLQIQRPRRFMDQMYDMGLIVRGGKYKNSEKLVKHIMNAISAEDLKIFRDAMHEEREARIRDAIGDEFDEIEVYGFKCKCCGTLNQTMVEEISYSKKKILNSGSGARRFLDNAWNSVDIPMCATCWAAAGVEPEVKLSVSFWFSPKEVYQFEYVRGHLLDQLKLTKATDFFSLMSKEKQNSVINHDLAIVRRSLTDIDKMYVQVGIDSDRKYTETVCEWYGISVIKYSLQFTSPNPNLVVHIQCASKLILAKTSIDQCVVYYAPMPIKTNQNLSYVDPSLDFGHYPASTELRNPESAIVFINHKAANVNMVATLLSKFSMVTTIAFKESELVKYLDDIEDLYMSFVGALCSKQVDKKALQVFLGDPIITGKSDTSLVGSVMCDNDVLKAVSWSVPTRKIKNSVIYRSKPRTQYYELDMPLPTMNKGVSILPMLNIVRCKVKIHLNLLRALCLYNITGNVSQEKIINYAVAFCYRKFIIGVNVIREDYVEPDVIFTHVLLCRLIMIRINSKYKINTTMTSLLGAVKAFSPMLTGVANAVYETFVGFFKHSLTKRGVPVHLISTLVDINMLSDQYGELMDNENFVSLCDNVLKSKTSVITSKKEVFTFNESRCYHYDDSCKLPVTKHICICCLLPVAPEKEEFCEACKEKRIENKPTPIVLPILPEETIAADELVEEEQEILDNDSIRISEITTTIDNYVLEAYELFGVNNVQNLLDLESNLFHDNNDMAPYTINLPMLPMGRSAFNSKLMLLEGEPKVIPNSDINSCGYEAFKMATGSTLSLNTFKSYCQSENDFSTDDLQNVASIISTNLVIVCKYNVLVSKNVDSDLFFTIVHSDFLNETLPHYYPATFKISGDHLVYVRLDPTMSDAYRHKVAKNLKIDFDGNFSTLEDRQENIMLEVLAKKLELEYTKEMEIIDKVSTIKDFEGWWFCVTNKFSTGIHTTRYFIRPELYKTLEWLKDFKQKKILLDDVLTHDIPSQIPNDWTEFCVSFIKTQQYLYSLMMETQDSDRVQNLLKKPVVTKVIDNAGKVAFRKKSLKIKTGDVVKINYGGQTFKVVIKLVRDLVLTNIVHTGYEYMDVMCYKISTASLLRSIINCLKMELNGQIVTEYLKEAIVDLGVPGSGKTTKICEMDKDMAVVVLTQGAKTNLIHKGCKGTVWTFESLNRLTEVVVVNNLVIDEATQFNYFMLSCVLSNFKFKQLYLFGDKNQIPYKDMSSTYGLRWAGNITQFDNFVKPIEYNNISYRFGDPLCSVLKRIVPEMATRSEHKTDFTIKTGFIDIEEAMQYANLNHEYEQVLCFYNDDSFKCRNYTKVDVDQVHSFQGREADTILVIATFSTTRRGYGLATNKNYLFSALSRAKTHCILLVIGGPAENDDFDTFYVHGNVKIGEVDPDIYETLSKDKSLKAKIEDAILKQGIKASVGITYKSNEIVVTIKKFLVTLATISLSSKTLKVNSINSTIEQDIFDSIINLTPGQIREEQPIIDEESLSKGHFEFKKITKEVSTFSKPAYFLSICLETGNQEFLMFKDFSNNLVRVSKTRDNCPVTAGIIFSWLDGQQITISHIRNFKRYLNSEGPVSELMLTFVEEFINDEMSQGHSMSQMNCNWLNYVSAWCERICKVNYWSDFALGNKHSLSEKCSIEKARLGHLTSLLFNDMEMAYPVHSQYSTRWELSKSKLTLRNIANCQTTTLKTKKGTALSNIIAWAINWNMNAGNFFIQYKDEVSGFIEGLLMPIESHIEGETPVGKEYMERMALLKTVTKTEVKDIVWVSDKTRTLFGKKVKEWWPKIKINSLSFTTTTENALELLTNTLAMPFVGKEFINYYWAGLLSFAPLISSKHYMSLYNCEKDGSQQGLWQSTIPTTTKLWDTYLKSTKKENTIMNIVNSIPNNIDDVCIVYDFNLLELSETEIMVALNSGKRLVGLCPLNNGMKGESFCYVRILGSKGILSLNGGSICYNVRSWAVRFYNKLKTIIKSANHGVFEIKILKRLNDVCLIELVKPRKAEITCNYISEMMTSDENILVSFPTLTTDISALIKGAKLFEINDVYISRRAYQHLKLRMMTGDNSIEGLMAYARTLGSTFETTVTGPVQVYNFGIEVYVATARYVWQKYSGFEQTIKLFDDLIKYSQDIELIKVNLVSIVKTCLGLLGWANDQLTIFIDALMQIVPTIIENLGMSMDNLKDQFEFKEKVVKGRWVMSSTSEGELQDTVNPTFSQKPKKKEIDIDFNRNKKPLQHQVVSDAKSTKETKTNKPPLKQGEKRKFVDLQVLREKEIEHKPKNGEVNRISSYLSSKPEFTVEKEPTKTETVAKDTSLPENLVEKIIINDPKTRFNNGVLMLCGLGNRLQSLINYCSCHSEIKIQWTSIDVGDTNFENLFESNVEVVMDGSTLFSEWKKTLKNYPPTYVIPSEATGGVKLYNYSPINNIWYDTWELTKWPGWEYGPYKAFKILKVRQEVLAKTEKYIHKFKIDFNKTCIAHIRLGDRAWANDSIRIFESIAWQLHNIQVITGIRLKLMVLTDDKKTLEQVCPQLSHHNVLVISSKKDRFSISGQVESLAQLLLLSCAKYFILNRGSTFNTSALLLSSLARGPSLLRVMPLTNLNDHCDLSPLFELKPLKNFGMNISMIEQVKELIKISDQYSSDPVTYDISFTNEYDGKVEINFSNEIDNYLPNVVPNYPNGIEKKTLNKYRATTNHDCNKIFGVEQQTLFEHSKIQVLCFPNVFTKNGGIQRYINTLIKHATFSKFLLIYTTRDGELPIMKKVSGLMFLKEQSEEEFMSIDCNQKVIIVFKPNLIDWAISVTSFLNKIALPMELIILDAIIAITPKLTYHSLRFEIHGVFGSPLQTYRTLWNNLTSLTTKKLYANYGNDQRKVESVFGYCDNMVHPLLAFEPIGLTQYVTIESVRRNFGNCALVICRGEKDGHELNANKIKELYESKKINRSICIVAGMNQTKNVYSKLLNGYNNVSIFTNASSKFNIEPYGMLPLYDIIFYSSYFIHYTTQEPWGLAISEAFSAGLYIYGAIDSGFYLHLQENSKDTSRFLDGKPKDNCVIGDLNSLIIDTIVNRWNLISMTQPTHFIEIHPILRDASLQFKSTNLEENIEEQFDQIKIYTYDHLIEKVLYNPETTVNCLRLCVSWILGQEGIKLPDFLASSMINPTVPSCLGIISWLGKFGIGASLLSHLYFVEEVQLRYIITITPEASEFHARVCSVNPMYKLIEDKTEVTPDASQLTSGMMPQEGWLQWSDLKFKKMRHNSSVDGATNHRSAGIFLCTKADQFIYTIPIKQGLTIGSLMAIIKENHILIPSVIIDIKNNLAYVYLTTTLQLNITVALHMGTQLKQNKTVKIQEFHDEVLESWATKKKLMIEHHKLSSLPVVYGILQANQVLYVIDYDNRNHHWRDTRRLVPNNLRVINTEEFSMDIKVLIVNTYDLPHRYGLKNSELVQMLEFSTRYQAEIIGTLLDLDFELSTIITMDEVSIQKIKNNCSIVDNKLSINLKSVIITQEIIEELRNFGTSEFDLERLKLGQEVKPIAKKKHIGFKTLRNLRTKYVVLSSLRVLVYIPSKLWVYIFAITGKGLYPLNSKMLTIKDEYRGITNYKKEVQPSQKLKEFSPLVTNMLALSGSHLISTDPHGEISSIAWEPNSLLKYDQVDDELQESEGIKLLDLNITFNDITDIEFYCDVPSKDLIDFYENTDMTGLVNLVNYKSVGTYRSNAYPNGIIKRMKALLNNYGYLSRSYVEGIVYESLNSANYRLRGFVQLQKFFVKDHFYEFKKCFDTYCVSDWTSRCQTFVENSKSFDVEETKKWVEKHEFPKRVHDKLIDFLNGGLLTKDYKKVNIHMKLESILKLDTWDQVASQKGRIIVWQEQFLAALFAPIINHCKKNLVSILNDKTIYVDGLTPKEISEVFRGLDEKTNSFFEADFSKQDRQTPPDQLKFETIAMEMLGFDKTALQVYSSIYNSWFFKMKTMWGIEKPKRHTGSPTTGFGNTMNSLRVYRRLVKRNKFNINLFAILSDDVVILSKRKLSLKKHLSDSKLWYNMITEYKQSDHVVSFIGCLVYKTSLGRVELGPNLVRMKYRYEVTNGVGEITEENMLMRTLSYCTLLGDTSAGKKVASAIGRGNLTLENWYNEADNILACANYYNINELHVISLLGELCKMMIERKVKLIEYRFFSEKRDRRIK